MSENWAKWVKIKQSESKWSKMMQKWFEVSQNEAKWCRISQKWFKCKQNESKLSKVNQNDAKWFKIKQNESKVIQSESNWSKMNQNEAKWVKVKQSESNIRLNHYNIKKHMWYIRKGGQWKTSPCGSWNQSRPPACLRTESQRATRRQSETVGGESLHEGVYFRCCYTWSTSNLPSWK